MYLDKILGSKTKVNMLAALVQGEREFLEKELAEEIGSSVSEVNRQIVDLIDCGVVEIRKVGRAKIYSINKKHFLFKPLKNLFRDLVRVYREIAKEIVRYVTKRHKVFSIILFGSLVKGKIRSDLVKEPSDIDLLIISKKGYIERIRKELASFINENILPRYGVLTYPIVISPGEYKRGLEKDQFIINVHTYGEVLYGEKPRKFG